MRWVSELLAILGESLQLSTMPIPPIQHSNFRRDPTATDRILSFRVHRYAHSTYRIRAVAHSVLLVIPPTDRTQTAARGFATLDKCQRKCARAVQTQTRKTNTQFTKSYHLAQHKRAYVVDTARVGSCFCVCVRVCVVDGRRVAVES